MKNRLQWFRVFFKGLMSLIYFRITLYNGLKCLTCRLSDHKPSLKIFFWCAPFGYGIFLFFYNEPELGESWHGFDTTSI
jgi:hypothetical protein